MVFLLAFAAILSDASFAKDKTAVFAARVTEKAASDAVQVIGTLRAEDSVELSADVTERVVKIHVTGGQSVKKGDLLIRLDDAEEQALRREELARINEAQRQVDRIKSLLKQKTATQALLDQQTVVVDAARARLAAIDAQITQRRLIAPFDGTVGILSISEGTLAVPGQQLLTLDGLSVLQADFSVPERFMANLSAGAPVKAQTSAYPKKTFTARIEAIDTRVDPVTRYLTVRAIFPNEEQLLKPGLLMEASIETNTRKALFIPEEAITSRGSELRVMRIEQSANQRTVKPIVIETGIRKNAWIEVVHGLDLNDLVVTHGSFKLSAGSMIEVRAIQEGNESLAELLRASANKQL